MKECPFCGWNETRTEIINQKASVQCTSCMAQGPQLNIEERMIISRLEKNLLNFGTIGQPMTKRKLTNWNETKYAQPDTDRGLPTFWAVLFVMSMSCLSWLAIYGIVIFAIWIVSILMGGIR